MAENKTQASGRETFQFIGKFTFTTFHIQTSITSWKLIDNAQLNHDT